MILKFKALGLAVVAMLVMGAFAAQGATANPLTCEGLLVGQTCHATGDQDGGAHVFKSAGGTVSCVEASFTGSGVVEGAGGAASELTVTASYPTEKAGGGNNCTAFGFAGAHVKMNECSYTFTTPSAGLSTGLVKWLQNQLHLLCPTGKQIEITPTAFGVSVCTQFVNPQTPTGGEVRGNNVGGSAPMDVTLEIALTSLHYTGTGSSCGNSETHTDATLTGNSTIKCYSDAAHLKQIGCTFS